MTEPVEITEEVVREVVVSGNDLVRDRFLKRFGDEVERFVDHFHHVYRRFKEIEGQVERDERSAWSQMFLYAALNSLITSTHLLVNGLIVPSGNLMRHFGEAVSMALLLSHRGLNTFESFTRDPGRFAVHKAVDYASRGKAAKLLNLNEDGWKNFKEIQAFYHQHSHASALTTASMTMIGRDSALVLGTEFDEGKVEAYGIELSRRGSACASVGGVILQVEDQLLNSRPEVGKGRHVR